MSSGPPSDWTKERIAKLCKLWQEGLSASQVAYELGGVSRNAVCGKIHRLGLSFTRPPKPPQRTRPTFRRPPRRLEEPVGDAAELFCRLVVVASDPVTLLDLEPHHCRWPIDGERAETLFCGAPKADDGAPYCSDHRRMSASPNQKGGLSAMMKLARWVA